MFTSWTASTQKHRFQAVAWSNTGALVQCCPRGNKLAVSWLCTEPYDVSPPAARLVCNPDKLPISKRAELTIYLKSRTAAFLKIMAVKESNASALPLIDGSGLFDLQRNEDI